MKELPACGTLVRDTSQAIGLHPDHSTPDVVIFVPSYDYTAPHNDSDKGDSGKKNALLTSIISEVAWHNNSHTILIKNIVPRSNFNVQVYAICPEHWEMKIVQHSAQPNSIGTVADVYLTPRYLTLESVPERADIFKKNSMTVAYGFIGSNQLLVESVHILPPFPLYAAIAAKL